VQCRAALASGVGTVSTRRSRELLPSQAPIPPPLLAEVRQASPEALVAGETPAAVEGNPLLLVVGEKRT
jgi:hypothetical protein